MTDSCHVESVISVPNGVKFKLVRVNTDVQPSISISVNRGYFHAQAYPQGLAHLLEHLMFEPHDRYNGEDYLDQLMFEHAGEANGWTQNAFTNFHLICNIKGFFEAVNILLEQISAPCFSLQQIKKEMLAIEAEFQSKKNEPPRRLQSVHKAICNPDHPFSEFTVGNESIFSRYKLKEIQENLRALHKEQFRAQNISICIAIPTASRLIPESTIQANIQMLADKVDKYFARRPIKEHLALPEPFDEKYQGVIIDVKGTVGSDIILVSFIISRLPESCRVLCLSTLCHLLESKHAQGLFQNLKNMSAIESINTAFKPFDQKRDEFIVSCRGGCDSSTASPSSNSLDSQPRLIGSIVDHIMAILSSYLQYLKNSTVESWRIKERCRHITQHEEALSASSFSLQDCIVLAQENHSNDDARKVNSSIYSEELSFAQMPKLLDELLSGNVRVFNISAFDEQNGFLTYDDNETIQSGSTSHYDVEYKVRAFELPELKEPIRFGKPRQNPFLFDEPRIIASQIPHEQLITSDTINASLKFYQYMRHKQATGECYVSITDPLMYGTTKKIIARRVWLYCINQFLDSRFYDVDDANMGYRIYQHNHGVTVHTFGESERQVYLLLEIINSIKTFKPTRHLIKRGFDIVKSRMQQSRPKSPLNRLFTMVNELYLEDFKYQSAIKTEMSSTDIDDLIELQNSYFSFNFLECLIVGNWRIASVERCFTILSSRFNTNPLLQKPGIERLALNAATQRHLQDKTLDSCALIWHIIPITSLHERSLAKYDKKIILQISARSLKLEKIISAIMFRLLRQQNSMAYELGAGYKPSGHYPGIAIYISSSSHSLEEIKNGIINVRDEAIAFIQSSEFELTELINDVINQVTPHHSQLSHTAKRIWQHFDDDDPISAYQELIEALGDIRSPELIKVLEDMTGKQVGQAIFTISDSPSP